jgi:hypothetical protein
VGEVGCAAEEWVASAEVPAVDPVAAAGRLAGEVDPGQEGEVGSVEAVAGLAEAGSAAGVAAPAAGPAIALK